MILKYIFPKRTRHYLKEARNGKAETPAFMGRYPFDRRNPYAWTAANEMMSSILGDNQQTNITEDMLNGLPDWITPEMVQGSNRHDAREWISRQAWF